MREARFEMDGGWLKAQWQARTLALRRRLALALGRRFDPYPPVPDGLAFSPSEAHAVAATHAALALDWRRAGIADAGDWQAAVRDKLTELTGYHRPNAPDAERMTDLPPRDGFRHRSLVLRAAAGVDLPIRLVWDPAIEGAGPVPVAICLQGTNAGMHLSWGEARMPADPIKIFNGGDYARQAARLGFLAVCLEQSCFGERREQRLTRRSATPCIDAANHTLLFGRCLVGARASDVSAVVSWLATAGPDLPVDPRRVYIMGSSSGGTTATYAAALDTRIAGVLASGCLGFMANTLLARGDSEGQNVVPGILNWFELDAVVALCAPRPFVTVSGDRDHIWPFAGAEAVIQAARPVYAALGAAGRLVAVPARGGHRFYPDLAWPAFMAAIAT